MDEQEEFLELELARKRVNKLAYLYADIPVSSRHAEVVESAQMRPRTVPPTPFPIPNYHPAQQQPQPPYQLSLMPFSAPYPSSTMQGNTWSTASFPQVSWLQPRSVSR